MAQIRSFHWMTDTIFLPAWQRIPPDQIGLDVVLQEYLIPFRAKPACGEDPCQNAVAMLQF